MISASIQGMPELLAEIGTLEPRIQRQVLRKSVYAGASVMRAKVRDEAPVAAEPHYRGRRKVQPGTLKRAVVAKWARELSSAENQSYVVTLLRGKKYQRSTGKGRDRDAFYWPWVEYGHKIVPRRGRLGVTSGALRSRRALASRYVAPRPFFNPAYRAGVGPAETAMAARARLLLDEVIR